MVTTLCEQKRCSKRFEAIRCSHLQGRRGIVENCSRYKRNWIQHVNRMPRNRLARVMKHYSPTGRRNHGRHLKRLLDTWDRNGSTSGPTPWQLYDGDDDDDGILCVICTDPGGCAVLRHRSAAARVMGSRVRILLKVLCSSLAFVVCCVGSGPLRRADNSFRGIWTGLCFF